MSNNLLKASDLKDLPTTSVKIRVEETETDDYGRRHWKVKEQEVTTTKDNDDEDEDDNEEEGLQEGPRETINLMRRTEDLGLDKVIGKRHIVTKQDPKKNQGVFFCELCDVLCKDSNAWLDHLNGKRHNRLLGMNMRVERVGVDAVRQKFESLKRKASKPIENFEDFDKKYEEDLQKLKRENKLKKVKMSNQELIKQLEEQGTQQVIPQLNGETDYQQLKQQEVKQLQQMEENKEVDKQNNQIVDNEEKEEEEEEEEDEELAMMAQMGLPTSFKSKK